MERSAKINSMEGIDMFNGTNFTLSSDVDQDTYGKVTKHKKIQNTRGPYLSDQLKKKDNQTLYKNAGYNMDIMQQSACLVVK